jgi:hypothetical protein
VKVWQRAADRRVVVRRSPQRAHLGGAEPDAGGMDTLYIGYSEPARLFSLRLVHWCATRNSWRAPYRRVGAGCGMADHGDQLQALRQL